MNDIHNQIDRLTNKFFAGKSVKSSMDDMFMPKMFSDKALEIKFEQIQIGRSRSDERRLRGAKFLDVKVNKSDLKEKERKKERIIKEFKERKQFNNHDNNSRPISKKEIMFNASDLQVREPIVETRLNIRPKDMNSTVHIKNSRY